MGQFLGLISVDPVGKHSVGNGVLYVTNGFKCASGHPSRYCSRKTLHWDEGNGVGITVAIGHAGCSKKWLLLRSHLCTETAKQVAAASIQLGQAQLFDG